MSIHAFPREKGTDIPQHGLTKREYFAAAALPGIMVAFRRYAEKQACQPGNGSVNDVYARIAYATADAMLNANNQKLNNRSY